MSKEGILAGNMLGGNEAAMPTIMSPLSVHQLRVTLIGSRPTVWRQLQVKSNTRLPILHKILQTVMGWQDYHLYQFTADGVMYGEPDPEFELPMLNAQRAKLTDVALRRGSKFLYEYDFGDGWEHQLTVEAILPLEPGVRYPVCLAGARACPPEDCGGVSGYANLRKIIRNPRHEEYEEMWTWLGGKFDPEAFDLAGVNTKLRRIR